jgi:hypothetical protein
MNLIPPVVASREMVVPPRLIEFPDKYKSRQRKVAEPRSYSTLDDGTMLPATSSLARGWLVPMPTFKVPGCMKRDVTFVVDIMAKLLAQATSIRYYKNPRKLN